MTPHVETGTDAQVDRGAERGKGHRAIARNAGHLIAANLVARALRVVYLAVLARFLGPELFGLLTYAQFWQLLFYSLVLFGTGRLLSREIGRDPAQAASVLAHSLTLRLLTGLLVGSCCGAAAWTLNPLEPARTLLLIFSLTLIARGLASWSQQVFLAYQVSHLTLRQEATWRSVEVLLGIVVLALGGGLLGVAAVHGLSWAAQAAAGLAVVQRHLHPVRLGWQPRPMVGLLADGASAMLAAFSLALMLEGGLVLYRTLFPSAADVGQLGLVLHAMALVAMMPKEVAVSALPALSRMAAAGGPEAIASLRPMLRLAILSAAAMSLLGLAAGPPVVHLLLGPDYDLAGRWLGPALWLALPFGTGYLLNQFLFAHGDYWANARCAVIAALLATGLLPLLAWWLNGLGVLFAIGIGLSLWVALMLRLARQRYGLTPGAEGTRALVAAVAAGLVWWGLGRLSAAWPPAAAGDLDGVAGLLAAPLALGVLALGLSRADWSRLARRP
jgi:O-antigen/teichoic acid export membrane protein